MSDSIAPPAGQDTALTRLLAEDYSDNLAEGHRRHPTQFAGPFVTAHVSLHHPGPFGDHFEDYLKTVFDFILDRDCRRPLFQKRDYPAPAELARHLKTLFSFDTRTIKNELLLYELEDIRFARIDGAPSVAWRLEVNREYLSFTLFSRLEFVRGEGVLEVSAMARASGHRVSFSVPHDIAGQPERYSTEMSKVLCRNLEREMEALFTPLLDNHILAWSQRAGAVDKGFRPPSIFARFTGPVVPWTVYGPGLKAGSIDNADIWRVWRGLPAVSEAQIRRNTQAKDKQKTDKCIDARPFFPRFREQGIKSATPDLNWALTCTNAFLTKTWPGLETHLLNGSQEDCVTCYMQGGHALYISSLGGRASPDDRSPSRYMILYDDPDGADLEGPAGHSTSHTSVDCTRRISRLVGRMHDLGVARLAALSGQANMKGFAQYLRSIEIQIQELNPAKRTAQQISRKLHGIHDDLYEHLSQFRTPLNYSSTRTAYHLNVIDDLLSDLNVLQIPGRQPYDRFVRRRFRAGLVYLTGIGDRLQRVTAEIARRLQMEDHQRRDGIIRFQAFGTFQAAKSARTIADLQNVADFFVRVLSFYYLPLTAKYIAERLCELVRVGRSLEETWTVGYRLDIPLFGQNIRLLDIGTVNWVHVIPDLSFLAALTALYIALPRGLIRDLLVFSRNPHRLNMLIVLACLAFPFQALVGLREGRQKLVKILRDENTLHQLEAAYLATLENGAAS